MSKLKAKDHYVKQEHLKNFALHSNKSKIVCFDFEKNSYGIEKILLTVHTKMAF